MRIKLNVLSTPDERYGTRDDGAWKQGLSRLLRQNTDDVYDTGGGSDMHVAENFYTVEVSNQKQYSQLVYELMTHGYEFTHWAWPEP